MANSKRRPRTHEEVIKHPLRVDLTTAELKDEDFSGIRKVEFDESFEIWVQGSVRKTVTKKELDLNPNALSEAMAELVQL